MNPAERCMLYGGVCSRLNWIITYTVYNMYPRLQTLEDVLRHTDIIRDSTI